MAQTVFQTAKRKAINGHKDWIVWTDRSGQEKAGLCTADTIKAALLDVGTKGRAFRLGANTGIGMVVRWNLGLLMLRNCRKGYDGPAMSA